ncbi:PrsW family intramembrane metalloprotease, partial [Actinomadura soli]
MTHVDPKAVLEGRVPGRPPLGMILGMTVSGVCVLIALGLTAALGGAGFWV